MGVLSGRVQVNSDGGKEMVIDAAISPGGARLFCPMRALLDTGATYCGIVERIAEELHLAPLDRVGLITAQGEAESWVYAADLQICFDGGESACFSDVEFNTFFDAQDGIEAIIGMDLICRGSLHIDGNNFTFTLYDNDDKHDTS